MFTWCDFRANKFCPFRLRLPAFSQKELSKFSWKKFALIKWTLSLLLTNKFPKKVAKISTRVFAPTKIKLSLCINVNPTQPSNIFRSRHLWHERRSNNVGRIHEYNNVVNAVHWLKWKEQHYDQQYSSPVGDRLENVYEMRSFPSGWPL